MTNELAMPVADTLPEPSTVAEPAVGTGPESTEVPVGENGL